MTRGDIMRKIKLHSFIVCLSIASILSVMTQNDIKAQSKKETVKKTKNVTVKNDAGLIGIWGTDERGGYEFKKDSTFIMEGATVYKYQASGGVWTYWSPKMPFAKVKAEYQLSKDGKQLNINLKTGRPMAHLKRIK